MGRLSVLSLISSLEHMPQQQPNQIETHGGQASAHSDQPESLWKHLPPTKVAAVSRNPNCDQAELPTGDRGSRMRGHVIHRHCGYSIIWNSKVRLEPRRLWVPVLDIPTPAGHPWHWMDPSSAALCFLILKIGWFDRSPLSFPVQSMEGNTRTAKTLWEEQWQCRKSNRAVCWGRCCGRAGLAPGSGPSTGWKAHG